MTEEIILTIELLVVCAIIAFVFDKYLITPALKDWLGMEEDYEDWMKENKKKKDD